MDDYGNEFGRHSSRDHLILYTEHMFRLFDGITLG